MNHCILLTRIAICITGEVSDVYESIDDNQGDGYEIPTNNAIYENEPTDQSTSTSQGGQINAAFEPHGLRAVDVANQDQTPAQYEQLDFSATNKETKRKPSHCKIDRKILVIIMGVIVLLIVVVIAVSVSLAMKNDGNDDNDSGWANWSSWGLCSVSCGTGVQQRPRLCTKTADNDEESVCPGPDRETQNCTVNCPINGAWTQWSSWSSCSRCIVGTTQKTRHRTCTDPAAQYGGQECSGSNKETENCTESHCSASVCFDSYTTFSESYRRESVTLDGCHRLYGAKCDEDKVTGDSWYRFKLPTGENGVLDTCPEPRTCGTCSPIWMTSSHPTEFGVIKDVTMATSWVGDCSFVSGPGSVTKCSVDGEVFYLYKLWKPDQCYRSYCAGTYSFGED